MTGSPCADLLKLAIRNGLMNMSAMLEMHGSRQPLFETKSRVRIEGLMLALMTCWLYSKLTFHI